MGEGPSAEKVIFVDGELVLGLLEFFFVPEFGEGDIEILLLNLMCLVQFGELFCEELTYNFCPKLIDRLYSTRFN